MSVNQTKTDDKMYYGYNPRNSIITAELFIGLVFYFGFFVNWSVLTLCPWCVLILIWGLIVAYFFHYAEGFFPNASEEDKRHLTDET